MRLNSDSVPLSTNYAFHLWYIMASQWFYAVNGQQLGPVSSAELKSLASKGKIDSSTLVWKQGMTDWVRADATTGLLPDSAVSQPPPLAVPDRSLTTVSGSSDRRKKSPLRKLFLIVGIFVCILLGLAVMSAWQNAENPDTQPVAGFAWFVGTAFLISIVYFIPTMVAFERVHPHRIPILVINLLLGFTLIGWVVAMVWAVLDYKSVDSRARS